MSSGLKEKTGRMPTVGMSQIEFLSRNEKVRTVLGSCIGLVLHHDILAVGGLAHIVLSKSDGRDALPGMFADTAIPYMIRELSKQGADFSGLVAKLAGGANMFDSSGPIQVGKNNVQTVREILAENKIPILGEHIGGANGRRITFDVKTGNLTIEIVGQPAVVL